MISRQRLSVLLGASFAWLVAFGPTQALAQDAPPGPSVYDQWDNGPSSDPDFLPIGVFYQRVSQVNRYKQIGVNTYISPGLKTDRQLDTLSEAGVKAVAPQTSNTLSRNDPNIIGWLQQPGEPDNAQSQEGGGYGPPLTPEEVQANYQANKENDSTRPVIQGFGRGVADDQWVGRGSRTHHPEDYPQYVKGADIPTFDIYPVASGGRTADQLWRVGYGVQRLRGWVEQNDRDQPVWNYLESTQIDTSTGKVPTPSQMRSEVWMSVVNGSRGILWFAHEFGPVNDNALLENQTTRQAVSEINSEVTSLASVINSDPIDEEVGVSSSNTDVPIDAIEPIDTMLRQEDGLTYLFTVSNLAEQTQATFTLEGFDDLADSTEITVLNEDRQLTLIDGQFTDTFTNYDAHLYRFDADAAEVELPAETIPTPGPASATLLGLAGLAMLRRRRRA